MTELRALGKLEKVSIFPPQLSAPQVCRLLAPPHSLRWKDFYGGESITETTIPLLAGLPLHSLDAKLALPHADFLAQMPQLTKLNLCCYGNARPDSERILQAVGQCGQLRELRLEAGSGVTDLCFSRTQLSACLAQLPQLESLGLTGIGELTTLAWLTEGRLPRTLVQLYLIGRHRRLPLQEWRHVLQLRALFSLALHNFFDEPLSTEDQALLAPPSPLFPHLTYFYHCWDEPPLPAAI